MGSQFITIKVPVQYNEHDIKTLISRKLGVRNFSWTCDLKSLDARKTGNIHWQLRLLVVSEELDTFEETDNQQLEIPYRKRSERIAVVGCGPAGFFAADILQKAGFQVTVFERGSSVEERAVAINTFESDGVFCDRGNYAYGEGGAGTFSDGKLTSRTKGISVYKNYVLEKYVKAGAPDEIRYLSKPHIGSNNLRHLVMNLREEFKQHGGEILFNTTVNGIKSSGKQISLESTAGQFDADAVVWATGHSAYDSFRLLMGAGVRFIAKPFALGVRVEHDQRMINIAMWKKPDVKGLKSAEYSLRWQGDETQAAYSFCMCPGGKIVQAAPGSGLSIVNGMSNYQRNSPFANAAIVVPVSPADFGKSDMSAYEMIERIETMERTIWQIKNSFEIPANVIASFINKKVSAVLGNTSYSHGVFPWDFDQIFPPHVSHQLRMSLKHFTIKIKGFEKGLMMGFESKTSCAVQVLREKNTGYCHGFERLYVCGEGSGFSGGIVSSAVDGIKTAYNVMKAFV